MVAVPVLAGRCCASVNGILVGQWHATADRHRDATGGDCAACSSPGCSAFTASPQVLLLGVVLGVAGASFAIALPMVSYWYPPEHQGTGAGPGRRWQFRDGVRLAVRAGAGRGLRLAQRAGPGGPAADRRVRLLFVARGQGQPQLARRARPWPTMRACCGTGDAWWLMFFYSVSFGGFVGLSSFLPIYFHDQYHLSAVTAGYFTAACVFAGSFARPFGGALADRIGGTRALSVDLCLVAVGPC